MHALDSFISKGRALVYTTRGERDNEELIETVHSGALSMVDGNGQELFSLGDSQQLVHARSTLKAFQLLPLVISGAAEKYNLDEKELALMQSSHDGSDKHVDGIRHIMEKVGLSESELLCGAHWPSNRETLKRMALNHEKPSVMHNNCSGKHVGMLVACKHNNWPLADYVNEKHPLQRLIMTTTAQLADMEVNDIILARDGCSAPTLILPLKKLARLYSRLANPQPLLDLSLQKALRRIFHCATHHPELIGGVGRLDTLLMQALPHELHAKTGADGGFALAIAPTKKFPAGLGVAIKIFDGDFSHLARTITTSQLLQDLGLLSTERKEWPAGLQKIAGLERLNVAGLKVGNIHAAFSCIME